MLLMKFLFKHLLWKKWHTALDFFWIRYNYGERERESGGEIYIWIEKINCILASSKLKKLKKIHAVIYYHT
jgi:hypothetical protein